MRRLCLFLAAVLSSVALWAGPAIRDIDITLDLKADGSAAVTEVWDVTATSGTEWYLVKDDLGVIRIRDISVRDESV